MKKKKVLSLILTAALSVSLMAGCAKTNNATNSGNKTEGSTTEVVKVTFVNSKGEIQTQLEEAAVAFTAANPNIDVEVIPCPDGTSPFEKISAMYASGNAPTLAMMDPNDIPKFKDKFADLSSEKWVADTLEGNLDAVTIDGVVKAFPLTIEGYGLIYNKSVLDAAGVDPTTINTTDSLKAAFAKIDASGVAPMILSPMDWSLGAHYLTLAYNQQDKDLAKAEELIAGLKDGSADLSNNAVFNGYMDTFDVLKEANIDNADALAGTYDRAAEVLGKGEVGFWFMGNWAWPQIKEFNESNSDFGFIPVPVSNDAADYGNTQITVAPSKFIGLDVEQNSQEQQDAAKAFLNWLVYDEAGQDILVNKANIIPAFKNITLEAQDPLAKSIKSYMSEGKTLRSIATLPGDHWAQVGAAMQKYLVGQSDRATLAEEIKAYWGTVK
ncbi:ABC transporter substrate-binding protein [Clostridium grantii]|uniref:Carbohydrate ABC transporter substrate-binding protein, CUT1 family n=1 Tax=Clostridium grantii DSM 8605 TaxID=1121316 RepID=A0A1M5VCR8_9CLOT|nr:ABC transporter substrate-binding protein [Clostridium grantii]SHH73040.1 carbohydrate ABC transporter substrate-binding protein, CUT1 family [Clostridium grantii DSM 8605]